jgi:tetratricopeptide (TPR) repeat protein
MPMWAAVLVVVVAQTAASGNVAVPACTGRGVRRGNVWERAKSPAMRRYCDLLASASSKLVGASPAASAALDAAHEAEAVLPGTAPVRVVEGRALTALGRLPEALTAFEDARARDARAFDEPIALLALARVLWASGRTADASHEYRALLPTASALPVADRTVIATEAGLVAMQLGPTSIDEAAADLREALRTAQGEAEKLDVLALSLALDRAGQSSEARTLLGERSRGDPRTVVSGWIRSDGAAVAPSEASSLAAFGLEASDPQGARDAWEESVKASPAGPWAAYANERLAALRAPGSRGSKR